MECEYCNKEHDGSYGSGRFCSEKCARGYATKAERTLINLKVSNTLTKPRITIEYKCRGCKKKFKVEYVKVPKRKRVYCRRGCKTVPTKETRIKLSNIARERKFGGHTSKVKLWYKRKDGKEIYLQSSYEMRVAKSLDENRVKWIRPHYLIWKDSEGKEHRYYPDFYLEAYNVYLDPKNDYLFKKDKAKINRVSKQNNVRILMLSEERLDWESIKEIIGV